MNIQLSPKLADLIDRAIGGVARLERAKILFASIIYRD
jgi:hypothetical protein